jgi:hypothetical protein
MPARRAGAPAPEGATRARPAATGADPKPSVSTRTADDILAGAARLRQRISNSGH